MLTFQTRSGYMFINNSDPDAGAGVSTGTPVPDDNAVGASVGFR